MSPAGRRILRYIVFGERRFWLAWPGRWESEADRYYARCLFEMSL